VPTVILGREIVRRFVGKDAPIALPSSANTVRGVIKELDRRYPGISAALSGPMAVSIDGQIYENCLLEPVGADSEVCFLPAIDGG
jgi:hypothetical protein